MKHNILSLDFWQDTAIYGGKSFPSGTLGCDALNIPANVMAVHYQNPETLDFQGLFGIASSNLLPIYYF